MTKMVTIDLDALNAYIDDGSAWAFKMHESMPSDGMKFYYAGKLGAYNDVSEFIEYSGLVPEEEDDDD